MTQPWLSGHWKYKIELWPM